MAPSSHRVSVVLVCVLAVPSGCAGTPLEPSTPESASATPHLAVAFTVAADKPYEFPAGATLGPGETRTSDYYWGARARAGITTATW